MSCVGLFSPSTIPKNFKVPLSCERKVPDMFPKTELSMTIGAPPLSRTVVRNVLKLGKGAYGGILLVESCTSFMMNAWCAHGQFESMLRERAKRADILMSAPSHEFRRLGEIGAALNGYGG